MQLYYSSQLSIHQFNSLVILQNSSILQAFLVSNIGHKAWSQPHIPENVPYKLLVNGFWRIVARPVLNLVFVLAPSSGVFNFWEEVTSVNGEGVVHV